MKEIRILGEGRQGTVVAATLLADVAAQNARAALGIADRRYVMESGKIVLEGWSDELLANDSIRSVYLGER